MSERWTEPDREAEALAEEFFSQPPPAVVDATGENWEAQPMSAGNRRAMLATVALLGSSAVASLIFALLSQHVFVAPAELGGSTSQAGLVGWTAAPAAERPAAAAEAPAPRPAQPIEAETLLASNRIEAVRPVSPHAEPQLPETRPEASRATGGRAREAAPGANGDSHAEALTRRAYRELGRGDAREAAQLANRALLQDGDQAGTYIVLAAARDALGDTAGARAAIRSCVMHAKDRLAATCKTLAR